jgi:hypothetical protein
MNHSVTTSAIAAVSKASYLTALKAAGFSRRGNHMFRTSNDLIHGIHFQASRWGSKDEGQFTINLVVTSGAIFEFWTGKPLPSNPATALFPIQQRIGRVMPQDRDQWWSVDNSTDLEALGADVTQTINSFALPYFSKYPENIALLNQLRQGVAIPSISARGRTLLHAIVAKIVGLPDEAAGQIRNALADADSSSSKATVERIGQRIGVL